MLKFGYFFTHPMRPFFALSTFCVLFACGLFWFDVDFVSYHKFAFFALVLPCAYAGFLLTAIPDWAKFFGNLSLHMWILFGLFLAAFFSGFVSLCVGYGFAGIFWMYLFGFCAYLLIRDKNDENFSILAILGGFCALNLAYAFFGDEKFLLAQIHLNTAAVIVVSFRVSIVIAKEALNASELNECVFIPSFVRKNLSLLTIFTLITAIIFEASYQILGYICIGVAFGMFSRLGELHHFVLLKRHYVAFYYAILLCAGIGYGFLGVGYFGFLENFKALHILTIGVILGAIMLIFNVAGLRHSGQNLAFSKMAKFGLFIVLLTGFFRALFSVFWIDYYIILPSILLALGFILWAAKYFIIFRDNEFSEDPE